MVKVKINIIIDSFFLIILSFLVPKLLVCLSISNFMGEEPIQKAQILKLQTPLDLLRLVVSNAQNRGAFLYYGIKEDKHILAISHLVPGWYNLRGLPITLIAELSEAPNSDIIRYKFASEDGGEAWEYVNELTQNTKYVYLPIVKMAQFPEFLY